MKPFIKWAGGKTQIIDKIIELSPISFNTYYEPFLGGGAVLFALQPNMAVVNDKNSELINVYNQIQYNPQKLISNLKHLDDLHNASDEPKNVFLSLRTEYNNGLGSSTSHQAALFIYLNKHCFNGLYRVNSKGKFNVSFNGKTNFSSYDIENIDAVSMYLKNSVQILNKDFKEVIKNSKKDDFVFFDPPYDNEEKSFFTGYTSDGFTKSDQIELSETFKQLSDKGVKCMLTNHNTDFINSLYDGFNKHIIPVKRNINRDGNNRIGTEIIITNYDRNKK